MHKKALITADIHPYLREQLEASGFSVDVIPEIDRTHLLEIIPAYSILIITTYTQVDMEVVDKATQLQLIGRVGSGMENVDVAYCTAKNIICVNSPEGNGNAVGEHCLAMLLSLLNNIPQANQELKQQIFRREENRGKELDGMTVGIIGYGHTGKAFARKLRGFEVEILVFDPYVTVVDSWVKQVSLTDIQQRAEVISFHVPYNRETHHYAGTAFLEQCRMTPVIINTSRGAVADTVALTEMLEQGKIAGVCIDVFEDEPLTKNKVHVPEVYQRLLAHPRVVATPHIAGWTVASKYKLVKILMDKISVHLSGIV
ncbi:MAG TPA: NAD(P)-dependent oxidoreductase [Chitinophagales bacterium]|nr:NAD(P)-dependent oxidoreductase [Chitinophagales bacterium]HQO88784.1 NAD(P)-dependent oxidoreductase [Chitinophagales bacterium]